MGLWSGWGKMNSHTSLEVSAGRWLEHVTPVSRRRAHSSTWQSRGSKNMLTEVAMPFRRRLCNHFRSILLVKASLDLRAGEEDSTSW